MDPGELKPETIDWLHSLADEEYHLPQFTYEDPIISHTGNTIVTIHRAWERNIFKAMFNFWDSHEKKHIWESQINTNIHKMFFSKCSRYFIAFSSQFINVFDIQAKKLARYSHNYNLANLVAISENGEYIAWKINSIQEEYLITQVNVQPDSLEFTPQHRYISDQLLSAMWYGFSPDNHFFICVNSKTINIWRASTTNPTLPIQTVRSTSAFTLPISISSDSKYLVFTDTRSNTMICNLSTWHCSYIPGLKCNKFLMWRDYCIFSSKNMLTAFPFYEPLKNVVAFCLEKDITNLQIKGNALLVKTEDQSYLYSLPLSNATEKFSLPLNRSTLFVSQPTQKSREKVITVDHLLSGEHIFAVTALHTLQKIRDSLLQSTCQNHIFLNHLEQIAYQETCLDLSKEYIEQLNLLPEIITKNFIKKVPMLLPENLPDNLQKLCQKISTQDANRNMSEKLFQKLQNSSDNNITETLKITSLEALKLLLPMIPDFLKQKEGILPYHLHTKICNFPLAQQEALLNISANNQLNIPSMHKILYTYATLKRTMQN